MRFIYNSSNELVEIVSLDNPDIAQATNVWRWNNGGFGFSDTGYNGTYGLAITQAGEIVANYITAGTLNANVIRAGLLTDGVGNNSWDLDTGTFSITNGTVNISTNNQSASLISLSWASGTNHGEATNTPGGYTIWDYSTALNRTSQITLNNGYITAEYRSGQNPGTLQGRASMSGVAGFKLLDGNQTDRAVLDLTGLTFYNSSGTQTATYPSDASTLLSANSLYLSNMTGSISEDVATAGTKTYTLTGGIWILTTAKFHSSSTAHSGLWIISARTGGTSNIFPVVAPSGGTTTASVSALTLTVTTGASYVYVCCFRVS